MVIRSKFIYLAQKGCGGGYLIIRELINASFGAVLFFRERSDLGRSYKNTEEKCSPIRLFGKKILILGFILI